jgi:hypothetical protein
MYEKSAACCVSRGSVSHSYVDKKPPPGKREVIFLQFSFIGKTVIGALLGADDKMIHQLDVH